MRRYAGRVLGVVVMMLMIGLALVSSRRAGSNDDAGRRTAPSSETPCGGAESSLEEAAAEVPFSIRIPHTPTASQESLKSVWLCSQTEVLLVFESGASTLEGINSLKDPEAEWAGLAKEYDEFSVGTVGGVPASLATPDTKAGVNGGVDFVVNEVRYTVTGNQVIPLEALLAVAESLVSQTR